MRNALEKFTIRVNTYKTGDLEIQMPMRSALALIQLRLSSELPHEGIFALLEDVLFPLGQRTRQQRAELLRGLPQLVIPGSVKLMESARDRVELINNYIWWANN